MFCSQEILQVVKIYENVLVEFAIWMYMEFEKSRLRVIITILMIFAKFLE